MSRKIVRVEIPSKRPEDLLALGQSLYAKHVADGDASPLDADKMTTLNNQATVADTQNKSAKLHDAQAQSARQVRDTALGIADGIGQRVGARMFGASRFVRLTDTRSAGPLLGRVLAKMGKEATSCA